MDLAPAAPEALARAAAAVELAQADARDALRVAHEALADARAAHSAEATSVAERALGLGSIELGEAGAAVAHLHRAVRVAQRAGCRARAAEARMSLSLALMLAGATRDALAEADRALPELQGHLRARVLMQRALILQKLGRLDEALAGYRRPLAAFRRHRDELWEARLLCNRGVLQVYRGALNFAEADFTRAEQLHASLGQELGATQVRHNLGWLAARRGDVPAALDIYDRVEEEYQRLGVPLALLLMDRCDVLLAVRLAGEARRDAERAAAELEAAEMRSDLAEARLLAARAAQLDGDHAAARTQADRARLAFSQQRRPAWSALARAASVSAAWRGGEPPARVLASARHAIAALESAGWSVDVLDARIVAGQAALALGRARLARDELGVASRSRGQGPVQVRVRAWHAEALLRLSCGDRRGAARAVGAGLRALEAHRVTLGATELRAHASGHGDELAALGLRLALESGSPARVLAAAERSRAAALLLRPALPPDDPELAAELAELRRVTAAAEAAVLAGDGGDELLRHQGRLEASVRRRARRLRGTDAPADERPPSPGVLAPELGEHALVEFVQVDGCLHAVCVAGGAARLRRLGAPSAVDEDLRSLRFCLGRLAVGVASPRTAATVADVLARAATRLDDLLFGPLRRDVDERPLIIVPTGALHALPWAALPSLARRPVTVVPSARLWRRVARRPEPSAAARTVLVAGPRLPAAAAEIETLRARHPEAIHLSGRRASIEAVADALDGAGHAHIAAHGRFRDDNPLFCSLELADGALTVYDLERLRRAPHRIVLSSCESGRNAVTAGDELMGFTAALFALGTATIIAAVVPVPDAATRALMLCLDDELGRGVPVARALARARARIDDGDRPGVVAGGAFVCFGAG